MSSSYYPLTMGNPFTPGSENPVDPAVRERERQQAIQTQKKQMEADAAAAREKFISAAERAAAKAKRDGSAVPESTFRDVVKIYNEEFPKYRSDVDKAFLDPDVATLRADLAAAKKDAFMRMSRRIGGLPGGNEAYQLIGQEAEGNGNIITQGVKKVYDSERGGIQWGGLLGMIGGGLLLSQLTAGMGPVISAIAGLIGGIALAFLGDKLIDKPAEPLKTPDFHGGKAPSKSAFVAVSKQQEKEMNGQHIESGQLKSPATPKVHHTPHKQGQQHLH